MRTILTVDDDPRVRDSLRGVLEEDGVRLLEAPGGALARELLRANKVDLVLLDVFLGDADGLVLLDEIRRDYPSTYVVMISGESDIPIALRAIRAGAWDFLEKPLGRNKLKITVRNVLAAVDREREREDVRAAQLARWSFVGTSAAMRELERVLVKAAPSTISVLLTGENGTGKEIAAHRLHYLSPRWARPFIKINCTAIPTELLESELFGHVKGSFTGAVADKKGLFLEADKGTIFLDEIGDMPPALQAKLLRVLQEREVARVGEAKARPVDVRVVAATNRDIPRLVRDGQLRQDLYFRLAGLELTLPPLRERPEDVEPLVQAFMAGYCFENSRRIPRVTPEAIAQLAQNTFAGNVRELKNVVERTLLLAEGDVVEKFLSSAAAGLDDLEPGLIGPLATVKKELVRRHLFRRLKALGNDKRKLSAELGVLPNNLSRLLRDYGLDEQ
jgi:two-component system, NtrC family, nitrogen regulation response regulator NtrX